jgi:hypothetical protein
VALLVQDLMATSFTEATQRDAVRPEARYRKDGSTALHAAARRSDDDKAITIVPEVDAPWAVEPVRERLELVVGHGGEQVGHDGAVKIPGALEVRNGVMGEARLEELLHRGRRAGREGGESQRCAYKGVRRGDGEVGVGDVGVGHAGASVARHLHRA